MGTSKGNGGIEEMKGNKWEYIRIECEKCGYMKSARIAKKIEEALVECYGSAETQTWKEATKERIESESIEDIAGDIYFCRGCMETLKYTRIALLCYECKYAKIAGECADAKNDSLFSRFCDALKEERKMINKVVERRKQI
jgi:hypothetical protein